MNKKFVIRRPINGISLNGYKYVTEDEAGKNIIFFDSNEAAWQYLIDAGYAPEELQTDLDNCVIDICEWEGEDKSWIDMLNEAVHDTDKSPDTDQIMELAQKKCEEYTEKLSDTINSSKPDEYDLPIIAAACTIYGNAFYAQFDELSMAIYNCMVRTVRLNLKLRGEDEEDEI